MVREIKRKLIFFVIIFLFPFQVFGEGDEELFGEGVEELDVDIFASVCKSFDISGLDIKCGNELYKVEVPLFYKDELIRPQLATSSTSTVFITSQ